MPIASRIEEKIDIPSDVELTIEGDMITAKGENGEVTRSFSYPGIKIHKEDSQICVEMERPNKRQAALVGTIASHIRNMIKGVSEGFVYKLKMVYSHFPMTTKVQGNEIHVENFLGEKIPRKTKIVGKTSVTIKGAEIEVRGCNIEDVGQTAANLEQLTRVKRRDPRVFQDGIYLVERKGVRV
ncbi:MAG: 50S ribosomal protein L6 [Candidatus Hydrothermarchaeaceae archaeon]